MITLRSTDLMIGDWVKWLRKPCRVDIPLLNTEFGDRDNSKNIEPIPLTPEILEKNGFELYEQDFTSHKVYKFGSLDYIEVDEWYMGVGGYVEYKHFNTTHRFIHYVFKLYYVHELQHALKLCGIEKTIEL